MLYLLNTPVVVLCENIAHLDASIDRIDVEKAKELLRTKNFESAIGHESTAKVLSELFGVPIAAQRKEICLKPGDEILAIKLKGRIPFGKELTVDELLQIGFDIYYFQFKRTEKLSSLTS